MTDCIFCKIASGAIPSKKLYEDEEVIVFHDIHPIAPVHFLLVPKQHFASLSDCAAEEEGLLGRLLLLAPKLAKEQGGGNTFSLPAGFGACFCPSWPQPREFRTVCAVPEPLPRLL